MCGCRWRFTHGLNARIVGKTLIKKDDELDRLEEDIRKLKNNYDQFFMGLQKVPPSQQRRNVETMIYEIGKQKMRDNTRRFRYNQLLSRYNQYRELWGRRVREREEGPLDFKRRQAALNEPETAPPPSANASRVTSAAPDAYVRVAADGNGEEIRKLYEQIASEQLKANGQKTSVTFEQLGQMVQKQAEMIRGKYNVTKVAFRVETVDGKVKLKAKPLQD
jgi:hypothetical protein